MNYLFKLGSIVATPGAIDLMNKYNISARTLLDRHISGDWGDLPKSDKKQNDEAVKTGEDRIFSSYNLDGKDNRIWIITEWDRSATTLLLPEEY